tara:strand:+ start:5392 stop:5658 length:267 start_codon:yes stop_codon:yes gene_type:complete
MAEKELPEELKNIILEFAKTKCKVCGSYMIDSFKSKKLCSVVCWIKFNFGINEFFLFTFYLVFFLYDLIFIKFPKFSNQYLDEILDEI